MGQLKVQGRALVWGEARHGDAVRYVLEHGVQQFLNVYHRAKQIDNKEFLWGDELEHMLVEADGGAVKLSLNADTVLAELERAKDDAVDWRPEYGSFMVESVPAQPYTATPDGLKSVQRNMERRYRLLDEHAGPNRFAVTLVAFPMMGVGAFTTAGAASDAQHSESLFVPDVCINNTHPRFANLTRNIRLRRGRKVCIQIPMFIDTNTMERSVDRALNIDASPRNRESVCEAHQRAAEVRASPLHKGVADYYYAQYSDRGPDERQRLVHERYAPCPCPAPRATHPCIYMDCMAFGMGCCCLQVTMQLKNEGEARYVYDQLAVLCPPFLAATAATPIQKGALCESDVRWMTISGSVDDRQAGEVPRIIKSRYDSVSTFLSPDAEAVAPFNDSPVEINGEFHARLRAAGVDATLARHVAHLFIRDPLVIFDEQIEIDDEKYADHFENIQSTNWQTVRFKPPPPDSAIGWRVEFRVMEVMPTPFENAAFSVFVVLLVRAIVKYRLYFYTAISSVDENMGRAHRRDALRERYAWRKDPFVAGGTASADEVRMMDGDEIFNGRRGGYVGLIPIVRRFIAEEGLRCPMLSAYLTFISKRCRGALPTAAAYLRAMVTGHPRYARDSRVTADISRDIVLRCRELASGTTVDEAYVPRELLDAAAGRAHNPPGGEGDSPGGCEHAAVSAPAAQ